jgi:glycosyltransferase involved in cell wall biosynthesis
MRILFLSRWFPVPRDNGSKLRVYNLLRGLSQRHDVTLLSFIDPSKEDPAISEVQPLCSGVHVIPWQEFSSGSRRARLGFFSSSPRFLIDTYSPQMASLIRDSISRNQYDLVIASQLSMASYCSSIQGLPALFEEIELGVFHGSAGRVDGLMKRMRLHLTWLKLRGYLTSVLAAFRVCTVVSEHEQRLFMATFPGHRTKVNVIPNCVSFNDYQGQEVDQLANQLIFCGSFRYSANYEAMQWFVAQVLPRILSVLPDTRLVVTGDHAGLRLPSVPNVILTGYVENIRPLVASSRVSVAPLLTAGGTRLKILEAMAIGTPVVSTSKGAEGLDAVPSKHLLIADSPQAFAEQVIKVLKDNALHGRLSAHARRFVRAKYDWDIVMPRFMNLVESAAS